MRKIIPSQVGKKQGNLRRFDEVGSVQVKATSKNVIIPGVSEIARVPRSNYVYAIHLSDQPHIEIYLDELEKLRAMASKGRMPKSLKFNYRGGYK